MRRYGPILIAPDTYNVRLAMGHASSGDVAFLNHWDTTFTVLEAADDAMIVERPGTPSFYLLTPVEDPGGYKTMMLVREGHTKQTPVDTMALVQM